MTGKLKPLPEYACICGITFGSNCAADDIQCPECESRRCPLCATWFGGLDGGPGKDTEFPASWYGGHSLIIEFGDEEFIAHCQCQEDFGSARPDESLDKFQQPWERHVMTFAAAVPSPGPADRKNGDAT
jgi:hypothetical protein